MSDSKRYSVRALMLTGLIAIVGTVLMLDYEGLIRHNHNKQELTVGHFRAIFLSADQGHRLSPKPAHLHAECFQGFVVVASDTDPTMKGLLVDYKNRGISCASAFPAAKPAPAPAAPQ